MLEGLSLAERDAYERALADHHTRRFRIQVLDLDGNTLTDLSSRLMDGQVVADMTADVSRTLTMGLLDPGHSINFDTDSPDDGALYADRMIRVVYIIYVPELGREVEVVIFVGPITKLSRDKDVLNVEAQSKEALGRGAVWNPMTLQQGYGKVAAFRTIMTERVGERRFNTPPVALDTEARGSDRLPTAVTLDRYSAAWDEAKKIGEGMGYQAFYSADGLCTLREYPGQPSFVFNAGEGGNVLSEPAISHVIDDVRNTVVVTGAQAKNAKAPVQGLAIAPSGHPLSPVRLAVGGRPRYLVEQVENTNLRTTADANAYAQRILDDRLLESVEVSFDALPIPHLEPGDLVRLNTGDYAVTFRLRTFSIPLSADGDSPMTVGYTRKTTIRPTKIRRR